MSGPDRVKPVNYKTFYRWVSILAVTLRAMSDGSAAQAAADPGVLCDRAATHAAQAVGVPIDILLAISRVETGRRQGGGLNPWPWTINADGKGTFYESKAEAVAAASAHLTDGTGTFDIGCFQLNIRWHGEGFSTFDEMFDPEKNASYAAKFLMSLYQESGNWGDAVAAYHSRTPELAQTYLNQVKAVLDAPGAAAVAETAAAPPPRENNFPLLQAGAQGGFGSIVPATGARGPLFGGNS